MNKEIQKYTEYCLNCPIKPCSNKGCPLNNDIPTFIKLVKEDKIEEAYKIISKTTVLGSICGRICPHMKQCEGSCIRGIKGEPVQIGEIESFVFDEALKKKWYKNIERTSELQGKKVAVVGGGPAGLTCASFLARCGAEVTIYEKYNKLGGILRHGIPDFRLPKDIVDRVYSKILDLGINVKYKMELGRNLLLNDLRSSYDAIFIAIGANVSSKMGIEGENLNGVYGGNELLEYKKYPDFKEKRVAVIGGGNVAMDTSRTIKRLGAKHVYVIYRRAEEQMPAEKKEIKEAKEEGIEFMFLNNIVKVLRKEKVEKIECIKTELVYEEGKRPYPVNIENSNYTLDMDYVVMAIGSKLEKDSVEQIEKNDWDKLKVDDNYRTSLKGVYAGGDVAADKGTVAWAARAGRDAAYSIIENLKNPD